MVRGCLGSFFESVGSWKIEGCEMYVELDRLEHQQANMGGEIVGICVNKQLRICEGIG